MHVFQTAVISLALIFGCFYSQDTFGQTAALNSIRNLNNESLWTLTSSTKLSFDTFHPQGLVKIGSNYFLSSVEIIEPSQRYREIVDGMDRSPGTGIGHLFKFNEEGVLLDRITLGENDIYHPGGIDFDGNAIWIPVAQYRPNSKSIIYRVDPDTLNSVEIARFDDHLGGIVHDSETNRLHGISWGSRRFYSWNLDGLNKPPQMTVNPSYFIDYQDCHYVEQSYMLCGGLNNYRQTNNQRLSLGGLALINLANLQTQLQIPVVLTSENGKVLTQNPFYFEFREDEKLHLMFIPDDNESTLYQYAVD